MQHIFSIVAAVVFGLFGLWIFFLILSEPIDALTEWWRQKQPKCLCGCGLTKRRARQINRANHFDDNF